MLFGAHISIANGIEKTPEKAKLIGCECFQFFTRSPQGEKGIPLSVNVINDFKKECKKYKFKEYYIHAPYFINLGSRDNRIYYNSISVLREELKKGVRLGAHCLVTHLGSARDLGKTRALNKAVMGLTKVLDGYHGQTLLLIEIASGAGKIIGDTFEEIKVIINKLETKIKNLVGVCFDSAHAFESGYNLRTKEAVKKTFDQFAQIIGLEKLKLIHANDSKTDLGSRIDRHAHIGKGKIGLIGFNALVNEPRLEKINMIIETPYSLKDDVKNLKTLKQLRKRT